MAKTSKGEACLLAALEAEPVPGWDLTPQHKFDATRRWTFDFAWPSQKLAIEVEGQRHRTHAGQITDSEKFNEAVRQGWRVLRSPARMSQAKARELVSLVWEILCCPPSCANDSDASE